MSETIETIYADPKYFKACQKIAGTDADDLYQFINIKILEKERAGKFKCEKLYPYYFTMAKREYYSKRDRFAREHRQRFQTVELTTFKTRREKETNYDTYEPTTEEADQIENVNAEHFEALDVFARTPSQTESIKMIKDVYLEVTKNTFKGITDLSNRTGIHKRTLYGALYRFRELYNDYIDTV